MDFTSLKQQAITIRDERERSANTATRVGRAMLETVNAVEENNTAIVAANANIATANANIATNTSQLNGLRAIYRGDLGDFASWTEAIAALDAMPSEVVNSPNGQFQIRVGGVPFLVNYACINSANFLYYQSVIGPAFINTETGKLQTAAGLAVNVFSRHYNAGNWGAWVRLAALSEVPTVQTEAAGTNKNYIYQDLTNNEKYVLSGVGKLFQYNGGLKLRLKVWGTGNKLYDDGKYTTFDCPRVNTSSDGASDHYVYARVVNNTLYEGASTTDAVVVNYTNFGSSGNKQLILSKATTAKAGVMTSTQVKALDSLSSHIVDLGDFVSEEEALRQLGSLGTCNDKKLVHAHLTYSTTYGDSTKNTLILIQSIHDNYCRQFIFNKDKIFQRGITFADDSLTQIAKIEDWAFLFGDRLTWNEGSHGYVLSQFGQPYDDYKCDSIPMASATADGLMSKEDKQLLEKIKTQLNL